jgi:hypothetical protein
MIKRLIQSLLIVVAIYAGASYAVIYLAKKGGAPTPVPFVWLSTDGGIVEDQDTDTLWITTDGGIMENRP